MRLLREMSGLGSRPYPLDRERRRRVMVALAEKDMSINDLAKKIGVSRSLVSNIINGRRLSKKTEQRIADYLGKRAGDLFPPRTMEEIGRMRRAEAKKKGRAA